MFKIVEAKFLSADVKMFRILAPRIARKQLAGQFVILRINDHGERIPITIAGSQLDDGTIDIIVQGVGKTTKMLNRLEAGDFILDVVGPLGKPSDIRYFGRTIVLGGGVGVAIAYPIARALRRAGNDVTVLLGARTADLVILEQEMREAGDSCRVFTDDGSSGTRGFVTDPLREMVNSGEQIDYVLAVGPIGMMRATAEVTRAKKIQTVVSLNAVMVDGTGMCGGCRVTVGGKSQFACVDGPEFDAHLVDFGLLAQRTSMYREMEQASLLRYQSALRERNENISHQCRLTGEQSHPGEPVTVQ